MPRDMRTPTMVSTCTPVTEECKYVFDIIGFSKHRGIGHAGTAFITSSPFSVGGHKWNIRFHPDGFYWSSNSKGDPDFISVYLKLLDKDAKVRASCDLSLVVQNTGLSTSIYKTGPRIFQEGQNSAFAPQGNVFMKMSDIRSSSQVVYSSLSASARATQG